MSKAKIEFDPDRKIIENLFTGSLRIEIPRYQRSYAWTTKETEDFFNDFVAESSIAEDNLDFLGTILFTFDENRGVLEVIDGQQRLLTISIFFAAMRDILRNDINTTDSVSYSDDIHNNLIKTGSSRISAHGTAEKDPFRIKVGRDLESFFSTLVQSFVKDLKKIKPKTPAERKAYDAYIYFSNKVRGMLSGPKSSDDKVKIIERMNTKVLGIQYIDIRVSNSETAYNLFESHNAKGQALAKTDLIKNYYFGRLKIPEAEMVVKMDEWDDLLVKLDKSTNGMWPDRFFSYMLQSYEGNFSSSQLYRRIKPMIDSPTTFSKLMKTNIESIIALKTSSTSDKHINSSLEGLNDYLRMHQCFIFLLSLHRNSDKMTPSIYRKIFRAVENFSYLYSAISSQPTNILEKIYAKYAYKLETEAKAVDSDDKVACERLSGKLLSDLKKEFINLIPSSETFSESFLKLSYTNSRDRQIIRYTFQRIEEYHSDNLIMLGFSFTLDHIIPQRTFGKSTEYHSIGNLVPLSQASNSRLGDTPPKDKLDVYKENGQLKSVRLLIDQLEHGEFTVDSISQRVEQISSMVYGEIFSIK